MNDRRGEPPSGRLRSMASALRGVTPWVQTRQGECRCRTRRRGSRSSSTTRSYEASLLRWCEAQQIEYAISVDLSAQLKAELLRLPETAWQLEWEEPEAIRSWAEVPYVPDNGR